MGTFISLLRGINVGNAKRVPMAELRAMLAELGHSHVATLLNSGNAVFHATRAKPEKLATDIANIIATRLKFEVPVIVKSMKEFAAIVAENPLAQGASDHARLLVVFAQDAKALSALSPVEQLIAPAEQFVIGEHAAYLHCATGILDSKAGAALLGKAGSGLTTRNWATVLKLLALAQSPPT